MTKYNFIKPGKKTKEWTAARSKLKQIYFEKGITTCELRFEGCVNNNMLSFAHRHKRNDPKCSHTYDGTLLACIPCHQKIESDRELTNTMFGLLRPV